MFYELNEFNEKRGMCSKRIERIKGDFCGAK